MAQHGAHGRSIGLDELERQGDEFVVAFGHFVEHEVFKDAQAEAADDLVAVERLAVGGVDAGGVDADQHHAQCGQPLDGGGRVGGEFGVEAIDGCVGIGAHQHARRQPFQGVLDVRPLHERAARDGVDHPAGAEIGREIDGADGRAVRVVVQWRICVRADVRRQRDLAHVDRTAGRDRRGPALLVGGVAGEDGRAFVHGWGNVPETLVHAREVKLARGLMVSVIADRT